MTIGISTTAAVPRASASSEATTAVEHELHDARASLHRSRGCGTTAEARSMDGASTSFSRDPCRAAFIMNVACAPTFALGDGRGDGLDDERARVMI